MTSSEKRRPLRTVVRGALALAALLAVAYVLRGPLFGGLVRGEIEAALADALGREVTIGGLEGDWLTELTLLDVRVADAPPGETLRSARAARIAVRHRVLDVLDDPLAAIDDIRATGLDLTLDVDGAPDTAAPATSVAEILGALPASLPPVAAEGRFALVGRNLDLAAGYRASLPSPHRLDATFDGVTAALAGRTLRQDVLRVRVEHDGSVLRLRAPVRGGGVDVAEATLADGPAGPLLSGVVRAGGEARVELDRVALRASVRDVDLARLPPLVRTLLGEPLPELPAIVVSADVTLADGGAGALEARDVRARLGDAVLTLGSFRAGDPADPATFVVAQLSAQTPDAAATAALLGAPVPDGVLPAGGPTSVALDCPAGDARSLAVGRLDVRTPRSGVRASGTVTPPAGLRDWETAALALDVRAEVEAAELAAAAPPEWDLPDAAGTLVVTGRLTGTPASPGASGRVEATGLALGERVVRRLDVEAALAGDALQVTHLAADADFGRVEAHGTVDVRTGVLSDTAFQLDVPDLEAVSALSERIPPMEGSVTASGSLTGSLRRRPGGAGGGLPDDVHVIAQVDADGLVVDRTRIGTVTAAGTLDGSRATVERLRVDGDLGRVAASGRADLATGAIDVPGFAVEVPEVEALSRFVAALDGVRGSVAADGTLRLEADEPWRDVRVAGTLTSARLELPGIELRDVHVEVDVDDGTARIAESRVSTPWGTASGAGTLRVGEDAMDATLERLDVTVERSALGLEGAPVTARLRAPLTATLDGDRIAVSGLDADVLGGRVRGDLARGATVEVRVTLEDLDLALVHADAAGRLSATLELSGDAAAPTGALRARVPELRWKDESGAVEIDARQDAEGLRVERCEIAAGELLALSARGYAPWTVGEDGTRRVPGRQASLEVSGRSDAPRLWLARFAPDGVDAELAELSLSASGERLAGRLLLRELGWQGADLASVGLTGDTVVELTAGPAGSSASVRGGEGVLRVDGEVRIDGSVDWRDPFASAAGLPDAALSGALRIAVRDVSDVGSWFGDLRSVHGAAQVDVALGGTVSRPTWQGELRADDLSVTAIDDLPPIDRGRIRASLRGRRAVIHELEARLGYAPVRVAGEVSLDDDGRLVLDLHATGENVQVVRTPYTRLRADLDVRLEGPVASMRLSGAATVTDAWYTKPTRAGGRDADDVGSGLQLFSVTSEPWASVRFDVLVQADRTIRVQNNVAYGALSLDMRLRGTGAVPEPEGVLTCRDLEVRLPVTRLTVETATVTFRPQQPFDPDLRVSAFTRIKGYDLDVQVSGASSDMRVLVATSPPMRQEDALVLLATGAPPADESTGNQVGNTAAAGAGSLLGEAALDWLSGPRTAGEKRITDRVEIYVGREVSESGLATVEAEFQITPGWFLRFERDRWEDYAGGILWRVRFP